MLYGPPGCGKTHIVKALAGEMGARLYALGLNDILDMWMGNSEKNLRAVFEAAKSAAPCVLFFDELDAIGRKRGRLRRHLLSEMELIDAGRDGVHIVGATSRPWDMGSELVRPGRFDRTVLVLPPDRPARGTILSRHLAGKPMSGIDLDDLAAQTDRFSGADLRLVVSSATELAMAQSLDFGAVVPLGPHHVDDALEMLRPSTGAWFDHARFAASETATGASRTSSSTCSRPTASSVHADNHPDPAERRLRAPSVLRKLGFQETGRWPGDYLILRHGVTSSCTSGCTGT